MASKPRKLISYTSRSNQSLDEIWEWNAKTYDRDHARDYIEYIRSEIDKLSTRWHLGQTVETRPMFRYWTITKRPRGHGHIVVYEVVNDSIIIVNVYHTSQNWKAKLDED
jgi:plasmid stabilization system protein ParE